MSFLINPFICVDQRRQSGLKSWGSWIRVKKSIFPSKFPKNFDFFLASSPKDFDFSRQISEKFRVFHAISQNISISQAKIGHLQLLFGKLFYFSSKVTTFEHTFCTWLDVM